MTLENKNLRSIQKKLRKPNIFQYLFFIIENLPCLLIKFYYEKNVAAKSKWCKGGFRLSRDLLEQGNGKKQGKKFTRQHFQPRHK